jgi:3-dehydroquinate dehydratase-2
MGMKLLVLHGPNLNLLGEKEGTPGGRFDDLNRALRAEATGQGLELKIVQSNHEGVLIDTLHAERRNVAGVVVNPAGLFGSHALRDALEAIGLPAVEVHLDGARVKQSVLREACAAQISGKGFEPYLQAIQRFGRGEFTPKGERARPAVAAAPTKAKTLGRKAPAAEKPAKGEKTIGRSSKETPAADILTRALVRQKIADRLAGKLSPAGLATWARTQWMEVQRGAPAESGHRDMLEDSLQTLTLSTLPATKLTDEQLVDMMTQLEG